MRADLHLHTHWSDGSLSPAEVARRAAEAELSLIAVTDHDTLRGSDELMASDPGIAVLRGVELSLSDMDGLHLLLYGRSAAPALRRRLDDLAAKREERARRMLEKLAALGMPIPWETVRAECRGTVGRPHIARAMRKLGYTASVNEAFERWIGNGKPAYEAGERLSMAEALALAADCGWVPVLAHPRDLKRSDSALRTLITAWQAEGLRGVEVYHPSAASRGYEPLERMARSLGLLVTGGSDFHTPGDKRTHGEVGATAGLWLRAEEDIRALTDAMAPES